MSKFRCRAAEIIPDADKDLLDLGGCLFRKGGNEIGAADAMTRHKGAGSAREQSASVGNRLAGDEPDRMEQSNGGPPNDRIENRRKAPAK